MAQKKNSDVLWSMARRYNQEGVRLSRSGQLHESHEWFREAKQLREKAEAAEKEENS